MYRTVEYACQMQELVCVMINDNVEDYLVGIIEGYDNDGLLLYNIDYRGVATCHIYLSTEKVRCIKIKPEYLYKISVLMNNVKNKKAIRKIGNIEYLKEQLLRWLYLHRKKLKIAIRNERIKGYIHKISPNTMDIEVVDYITEESDGHMILSLTELKYFCVEDDIGIEKIV